MPKRKEYIESPQHWKDMYANPAYNGVWKPINKTPIENIKIDKSFFAFQNEVDQKQVVDMVENFSQDVWIPILVNQNFYLLDGQHRLAVARKLRLKYIDVIIENKSLKNKAPLSSIKIKY